MELSSISKKILSLLQQGELSVSDIAKEVGIEKYRATFFLSFLEAEGYVTSRLAVIKPPNESENGVAGLCFSLTEKGLSFS